MDINATPTPTERKRDFDATISSESTSESAALVAASASPYLVYSKSSSGFTSTVNTTSTTTPDNDKLHFRTGRWTQNETNYVACLVKNFDGGMLNLPEGIKTNEFLRDLLMCKSSRLTKKYKNAKLSTRLYQVRKLDEREQVHIQVTEGAELSKTQQRFLDGVSEVTSLILRFNLNRVWRQYLFDISLQVKCTDINVQDWLKSNDDLDILVADAEEQVRLVRRRRMKMAFQYHRSSSTSDYKGVFLKKQNVITGHSKPLTISKTGAVRIEHIAEDSFTKDAPIKELTQPEQTQVQNQISEFEIPNLPLLDIWSEPLNFEKSKPSESRPLIYPSKTQHFEAFDIVCSLATEVDDDSLDQIDWDDLGMHLDIEDDETDSHSSSGSSSSSTILHQLMTMIKNKKLPFHYVDMWVPFQEIVGEKHKTFLTYEGDAIRSDLPPSKQHQLKEFGLFSRKFVFSIGAGMPGRVYKSSSYSWERNVQNASAEYFRRVGGARLSNICSVVGIPVLHPKLGSVVIGIYSLLDLEEDACMAQSLIDDYHSMIITEDKNVQLPGPIGKSHANDTAHSSDHSSKAKESLDIISSYSVSNGSVATTVSNELSQEGDFFQEEVKTLVNLLSIHMPINDGIPSSTTDLPDSLETYVSLRLLLLRFPSGCTESEKNLLKDLKKSWQGYTSIKMNGKDVVEMLAKDWLCLSSEKSDSKPPWGLSIAHTNYSTPP